MKNTKSVLVSVALTSCLLMNTATGANANAIAKFYNGKQVKIVVAARAGGGYCRRATPVRGLFFTGFCGGTLYLCGCGREKMRETPLERWEPWPSSPPRYRP